MNVPHPIGLVVAVPNSSKITLILVAPKEAVKGTVMLEENTTPFAGAVPGPSTPPAALYASPASLKSPS